MGSAALADGGARCTVLICLVILFGGIAGSLLDVEGRLEGFGGWLRTRLGRRRSVARHHVSTKTQNREALAGHVPAGTVSTEPASSDVLPPGSAS